MKSNDLPSCGQCPPSILLIVIPDLKLPSKSARPFASFRGSNIPCATSTGPSNIPSFTFDTPLSLDDPKSPPSNSLAVRGGGNFDPEIMTFIAPGSNESRKIPSQRASSTAAGLVGYKFLQID